MKLACFPKELDTYVHLALHIAQGKPRGFFLTNAHMGSGKTYTTAKLLMESGLRVFWFSSWPENLEAIKDDIAPEGVYRVRGVLK
jgi:hypothetical protein